ncbi:hypothetical protein FA15DRAFT_667252 [Coprinopsis marcescibilis]|uniref:BTB domain-containing protein n=1 Tax=Coprinopsis marcescibilis TaxID=230819 RepID=A0A5C3L0R8_COPMA|nr:hypothetical protein FA15DRAFT_667252 [Coprinopsis marcescibilis]
MSQEATTANPGDEIVVAMSTSFYPGSYSFPSDIIFASTDNVLFYVHSRVIAQSEETAFLPYLHHPQNAYDREHNIVAIPEGSTTLSIILHTLYGSSSAPNSPNFMTLSAAVDRMPVYGITPKRHILPGTHLFNQLMMYAPLQAIYVYALAAHHGLAEVAMKTSSHLLGFNLSTIDDDIAQKIGPTYLKRLFLLHLRRTETLKKLLSQAPHPHAPKKDCTFEDQKKFNRAWVLTTAYLLFEGRPDLSTHRIQVAFDSLTNALVSNSGCRDCLGTANAKIREIIVNWASVKCTI